MVSIFGASAAHCYTPAMDHYDSLSHLITSRRSIRHFTDEQVDSSLLADLLQKAMWAPSAHNRQPWRFAVLQAPAVKASLATAMGARLRADRTADGDDPDAIDRDVARSHARLTGAPAIIIVCSTMTDMDRYPDARRRAAEERMAVQSVAMAAQNLLLLAHAAGLGACWLCAPLFVPQLVRQTLALPADWQPEGLITIGHPVDSHQKMRVAWKDNVTFL